MDSTTRRAARINFSLGVFAGLTIAFVTSAVAETQGTSVFRVAVVSLPIAAIQFFLAWWAR